jgi:hypothetical protein
VAGKVVGGREVAEEAEQVRSDLGDPDVEVVGESRLLAGTAQPV